MSESGPKAEGASYPDWYFLLKRQGIRWDPEKSWPDRSRDEKQVWEEGRVQEAQERAAAYDVLLQLHTQIFPERYGKRAWSRWWRRKQDVIGLLEGVATLVDRAVDHHPKSR